MEQALAVFQAKALQNCVFYLMGHWEHDGAFNLYQIFTRPARMA
jgi:hypothetical protein